MYKLSSQIAKSNLVLAHKAKQCCDLHPNHALKNQAPTPLDPFNNCGGDAFRSYSYRCDMAGPCRAPKPQCPPKKSCFCPALLGFLAGIPFGYFAIPALMKYLEEEEDPKKKKCKKKT